MEGVGRKKPLQLLQREPQACVEHYWHQQSKSVFWDIKMVKDLDQYPNSTKTLRAQAIDVTMHS